MRWVLSAIVLFAWGCDSPRTASPTTVDGVLTFDAAALAPEDAGSTARDAGPPRGDAGQAPDAGMVGRTPDGVLTNRPEIMLYNVGLTDLVVLTAAYRMFQRDDGSWTFTWSGEVENQGTRNHCIVFFDTSINGIDVLTVVEAPVHAEDSATLGVSRWSCLGPGHRGYFFGIENDVSADFLSRLDYVDYDMSSTVIAGAYPDPANPSLQSASVEPNEDGEHAVRASYRLNATSVYNFTATFFPKIDGLVWNSITLYHLEDEPAFATFEEVTPRGHDLPFTEYGVVTDYLVRRTTGLVDFDAPEIQALSRWRSRRTRVRALAAAEEP